MKTSSVLEMQHFLGYQIKMNRLNWNLLNESLLFCIKDDINVSFIQGEQNHIVAKVCGERHELPCIHNTTWVLLKGWCSSESRAPLLLPDCACFSFCSQFASAFRCCFLFVSTCDHAHSIPSKVWSCVTTLVPQRFCNTHIDT